MGCRGRGRGGCQFHIANNHAGQEPNRIAYSKCGHRSNCGEGEWGGGGGGGGGEMGVAARGGRGVTFSDTRARNIHERESMHWCFRSVCSANQGKYQSNHQKTSRNWSLSTCA